MNNPIAFRLGITKNWSNNLKDLMLIKGFFKALDMHISEIYLQTHSNNIYLYLYISYIRYYSKKDNVSLYKNFIKFIRYDTKINNNNFINFYNFRFTKFQTFYFLYYIKILKLLLNCNKYNLHIIKINHVSRNTNIFLSYLTHSLSLNSSFKFTYLKYYYYNRSLFFYPRKHIKTHFSDNKKYLKINNNTQIKFTNKNLHFYYSNLLKNNILFYNKFKNIQKTHKALKDFNKHIFKNKYKITYGRQKRRWLKWQEYKKWKKSKKKIQRKIYKIVKTLKFKNNKKFSLFPSFKNKLQNLILKNIKRNMLINLKFLFSKRSLEQKKFLLWLNRFNSLKIFNSKIEKLSLFNTQINENVFKNLLMKKLK